MQQIQTSYTHAHTHAVTSKNGVLILIGVEGRWKEDSFWFGLKDDRVDQCLSLVGMNSKCGVLCMCVVGRLCVGVVHGQYNIMTVCVCAGNTILWLCVCVCVCREYNIMTVCVCVCRKYNIMTVCVCVQGIQYYDCVCVQGIQYYDWVCVCRCGVQEINYYDRVCVYAQVWCAVNTIWLGECVCVCVCRCGVQWIQYYDHITLIFEVLMNTFWLIS